jgi:hypothetical protein
MIIAQFLIIVGFIAYFAPQFLHLILNEQDAVAISNNALAIIISGFLVELIFIIQVIKHKRSQSNESSEVIDEHITRPARAQLGSTDYQSISRSPLKKGGTNFKTHKLQLVDNSRIEFKPSIQLILFSALFSLIGAGLAIGFLVGSHEVFPIFIGLIFVAVGIGMFIHLGSNKTFDRHIGWFWQGSNKDNKVSRIEQCKNACRLNEVKAVQVIKERVTHNKGSYYSYEINLVRSDNSRINVVDHGSKKTIDKDAQQLADFLRVPII